jgi:hypothetical protein
MKHYPSILGSKFCTIGKPGIAFYKYDGSNLRWEWNKKSGWNKFGTRNLLFDRTTEPYNQSIEMFLDDIGPKIIEELKQIDRNLIKTTAFTEFFGPNSFAGSHEDDDPKELRLFDVMMYRKGFIPPDQFVEMFGKYKWSAEVIYRGEIDLQFIQDVREGKYPVVEGVVCKGDDFVFKVKTNEYLAKLKRVFQDKWEDYAE